MNNFGLVFVHILALSLIDALIGIRREMTLRETCTSY